MGSQVFPLDGNREVRVRFNVHTPEGWHLWMSLYAYGHYVDADVGPVVADLDDATLERAAQEWIESRA